MARARSLFAPLMRSSVHTIARSIDIIQSSLCALIMKCYGGVECWPPFDTGHSFSFECRFNGEGGHAVSRSVTVKPGEIVPSDDGHTGYLRPPNPIPVPIPGGNLLQGLYCRQLSVHCGKIYFSSTAQTIKYYLAGTHRFTRFNRKHCVRDNIKDEKRKHPTCEIVIYRRNV